MDNLFICNDIILVESESRELLDLTVSVAAMTSREDVSDAF